MSEDVRNAVLRLMEEKTKIEEQIQKLGEILAENGVGMNDPIIDDQGFPLPNIDHYQVRYARREIICLQNDHKAIMKKIEDGLSDFYRSAENTPSTSSKNS